MEERNQDKLYADLRHFVLNLFKRDQKAAKAINDHRRLGLTPPHIESNKDILKFQQSWEWLESFHDGGLKVKINGREFYARYSTNGSLEQLTRWDNYFPEE